MQVKVLFVDLDGTLIGPSGDVAPELWPALEAARRSGLRLSVCTGRPSGGIASRIAARLDPDTPHIFHGGAVARFVRPGPDGAPRDESPLSACAIDTSLVLALIEEARRRALTLELYTPDAYFVDHLTEEALAHARLLSLESRAIDLAELARTTAIVKMQWVIGSDDAATADQLARQAQPGIHAAQANSPALPGVHFVTLTRTDADKGAAVRRVAERLGVSLAETAGVGDSTGDLPMLEVVGHPYIMGDATVELRARFSSLPGVAEHGVRTLLEQLAQAQPVP